MSESAATPVDTPQSCQAIPGAARRGWRTDLLCASVANSEVSFQGRPVAVCRIHRAVYERWGDAAEQQAVEVWRWAAEPGS